MNTPSRVLISGASGLIGTSLVRAFTANRIAPDQVSVVRLVRKPTSENRQEICWSPLSPQAIADLSELEDFDVVIHLSGANLAAHRWTPAYKREIVESRVQTTQALSLLLAGLKHPPQAFLCSSATGIYGNRGDEILTENSTPGSGFLAESCMAWEAAADSARAAGIRVVHLRFGVVFSAQGGALAKMLPLFRLGLAGRLGSGHQWMSWISLPDVVNVVSYILTTPELTGAINMVSPIPVTNAEFTRTLARAVHRPAILPAPAFALRAALGEFADEALLASTRAVPGQLMQVGYRFQHEQLASAFESLLGK
ncbi:MAG: TIGR01777 family oxidoreductase [Alloacidobacterium sp.]|jgi:uncharacterized protein (TIGR01777 family)